MQFSIAATILALASAAFAQERAPNTKDGFIAITTPDKGQEVLAGTTFTIKWTVPAEYADIKVNLIYVTSDVAQNLQVPTLNVTRGLAASAGEFAWDIPADLGGNEWNGFIVEDVADTYNNYQFSNPFKLLKNADAAVSSGLTSTVTVTTASGTATVTLSSASITSSATSSAVESSSVEVTSAVETTTTTTTSAAPNTLVTAASSSSPVESSSATETEEPAETISTQPSGAGQAKAGLFAVFSGLAIALML